MNKFMCVAVAFGVALTAAVLLMSTGHAQPPLKNDNVAVKWEYKMLSGSQLLKDAIGQPGTIQDAGLNKYGNEGWELVSVIETNGERWFTFKRRK